MEQNTRVSQTVTPVGKVGDGHLRIVGHQIEERTVTGAASTPGWDVTDRSDGEISDTVAGLAGRISAATCEWLGYVAEADRRGLWAGFASTAAWLSWRCGIGLRTAADQIRVARSLVELPVIRLAFADGRLSYSQVRALIRGAGIVPEAHLVELARHATGAQLERLVRALRGTVSEEEEGAAQMRQRAHWHVEDDGSLVISARLSGDWADAWMAALEQAEAQARRQSEGRVTQAAIIATIAGRALTAEDDADIPTPTVGITADLDALVAAVTLLEEDQPLDLEDVSPDSPRASGSDVCPDSPPAHGPGVSAETPPVHGSDISAETPPCPESPSQHPNVHWNTTGNPASITTLAALLDQPQIDLIAKLSDGTLIDLGRSRRRPSARLTRTVLNRHGNTCAHPHCRARAHLHLHHVQHWSQGGATSADNLIPLCGRHHRALHRGAFTIRVNKSARGAARYRFTSPSGSPLTAVAWTDPQQAGTPAICRSASFDAADHAGRSMIEVNGRAERMSLDYAVGVLLQSPSQKVSA